MNTTHSPLPWRLEPTIKGQVLIVDSDGQAVLPDGLPEPIAQTVVTACNSHAALLGALERTVDTLDSLGHNVDSDIRQAIALAKGVQS